MMSPSKSTERLIGHDKLANNGDDVNVAVCRAKRRGNSNPRLWRNRWRCDDEKWLSVTSPRPTEAKIWLTQNARTKQTIRIFWNILFFFKCVASATICQMRHVCDDLWMRDEPALSKGNWSLFWWLEFLSLSGLFLTLVRIFHLSEVPKNVFSSWKREN